MEQWQCKQTKQQAVPFSNQRASVTAVAHLRRLFDW
jgi:hypothetical protein